MLIGNVVQKGPSLKAVKVNVMNMSLDKYLVMVRFTLT